jgi:hypothetical protein
MTNVHAKCQSKNPERCVDPQCPERRGYRTQIAQAKSYTEFEAGAKRREDDQRRQRQSQFSRQASNYKPKQETTFDGDPVIKFHRDLGFPQNYTPPSGARSVVYSKHAKDEAQKDIYGSIPQLERVNLDTMELVELKVNARTKQVYRYLYRGELDDENDVCLVLQPTGKGKMLVVTNWINKKSDKHKTLRADEYVRPRQAA